MTLKELRIPALVLSGLVLAGAARAAVTEKFAQTYPLAANGTVHLENVNGDIDIIAWDKAEVSLEAEKKGKTDADLAKVTLEIDATPSKLSIKTKHARSKGWFGNINASVRYKLMVPAGVRLEKIDTVNSDITVSGVRGPVNLDTVNGRITATGLAANARLDSVNGSLNAEFASMDGVSEVKLDSVNGRATITLPKGAGASIDADSVNGSVSVDQQIKLGKVRRHSLTGQIGGGGAEISLETVNGSISIKEK
jgi:DUF4097 and DUF4098 domain-containing protein YvlB